MRINFKSHLVKHGLRIGLHLFAVQQSVLQSRLASKINILGHGQMRSDGSLLLNNSDSGVQGVLRSLEITFLSVQEHLALRRLVNRGNDFNQRGFSGAVLTDQSMALAGIKVNADILQRLYARKFLGNILYL